MKWRKVKKRAVDEYNEDAERAIVCSALVTLVCNGCGKAVQYEAEADGGYSDRVLAPVAVSCKCGGILGALITRIKSLSV